MPWFIVDDGFHSHKKAVRAGVGAVGLWVLAGSWSADQLTDGFVPDYIAARLDPSYEEHAAALVKAGLWTESQVDGDDGWQFHEWAERQQSRDDVMAKREAARERMRRLRERKKNTAKDSPNVRANTSRSDDEVREPDTYTDTYTNTYIEGDADAPASPKRPPRATAITDAFAIDDDLRKWAKNEVPHVDIDTETKKFVDHHVSRGNSFKQPSRAWKKWMRQASEWSKPSSNRQPSLPPVSSTFDDWEPQNAA